MNTLAIVRPVEQQYSINFSDNLAEVLASVTRSILKGWQLLWQAFDKQQWNDQKESLGWTAHTHKPYIRVWQWIEDYSIPTYNLELLDEKTLLELPAPKYSQLADRLKTERLTVAEVRSEMSAIAKELKTLKAMEREAQQELEGQQLFSPFEYHIDSKGNRLAQINVPNSELVDKLETEFKRSELPFAIFMNRTVELWQRENDNKPELNVRPSLPLEVQQAIARENRIHELNAKFTDLDLEAVNNPTSAVLEERELVRLELLALGIQAVPTKIESVELYRVRQLDNEDYIWLQNCQLLKEPNPPINNWYVFASPDGAHIRVAGDDEFASMQQIGIGAKVKIISNHPRCGEVGEIVGMNGNLWKVMLDIHKQQEDVALHIPVTVHSNCIELLN